MAFVTPRKADLLIAWKDLCTRAAKHVDPTVHEDFDDRAINFASEMRALAHKLRGVACSACYGFGERAYATAMTWRGDHGPCSLTWDVCDVCWGTGRIDRVGVIPAAKEHGDGHGE